jgi:murein L,D-transpeptidase YcbB/YkuD
MNKMKYIFLILLLTGSSVTAQKSAREIIKQRMVSGEKTKNYVADGKVLFSKVEMPKIYADADYDLIWKDKKNREDLLKNLKESFDEGLLPEDYHLKSIENILSGAAYSKLKPQDAADADMLMTDALLLYASHLVSGKVEQSQLHSEWDVERNKRPERIDSLVSVTLKNHNLNGAFQNLKPQHYYYMLLRMKLKEYREIEENGGWNKISEGETLKKGMKDARIIAVRDYLKITKDLPDVPVENDSLFDDQLEKAVKKFQERLNLTTDGAVGTGTLKQMNIPVHDRIDQIRINLERARWVMHHPEDDFLIVNIAGFYVKHFKNKKETFSSRVIVGKYNKSTPIFKDTMEYIILNPTWTLPYSIATHETLPKLKKDPGYLAAKHMVIMDRSGKILNPNKINFHKYSTGNFPFIIRQEAGPWNALGQVKFIFPNKNSVYLHDTPSRSLFKREDRAFSHGCIRAAEKWGLLMNLMDDPKVWNMDKINEILKSGETKRINLPRPVPIYLLYFTAGIDTMNNIYFIKDVYKRDPAVLKALDTPVKFRSVK